jgi:hypothetical protein
MTYGAVIPLSGMRSSVFPDPGGGDDHDPQRDVVLVNRHDTRKRHVDRIRISEEEITTEFCVEFRERTR